MANLTFLDIAKRNGSDREVGLIEDVITYAPEVAVLPVRPINGVSFKSTLRTAYPTGSAFRNVGSGASLIKSTYEQKLAECFFIDKPMQVDEALIDTQDMQIGDVLADEVQGTLAAAGIDIGAQLYYGTSASANGFQGLTDFVGSSSTYTVTAAGTGSVTTSAWLVYLDIKGVHFIAGRTAAGHGAQDPSQPSGDPAIIAPPFRMPSWTKQQVVVGTSGKVAMAYVSNVSGWMGLAYGSRYSAFRVRNISIATGTGAYLTDTLAAQLLSKVPLHIRNSGRLRWFLNRDAAYSLQASRQPTTVVGQVGGPGIFAQLPTEMGGIPITTTDSITTTETAT